MKIIMACFGGDKSPSANVEGAVIALKNHSDLELILTGDTITADEALRIGLVSRVVAPDELMNTALAMAAKIANNAPVAVMESKKAIRQFWCADIYTDLEFEAGAFSRCFATEDQKTGMTAFLNKKPHDEYKGN